MKKYFLTLLLIFVSCDISSSPSIDNPRPVFSIDAQDYSNMSKAYFASGCFWCVETIYESIDGVKEVYSGYAGGTTINPNYYQVMTGKTGHAEAIEIIYDENKVSFETLLKVFFDSHDPTTPNRQGPDFGTQYRSIAFFNNEKLFFCKISFEFFFNQLKKLFFLINECFNISAKPQTISLLGKLLRRSTSEITSLGW